MYNTFTKRAEQRLEYLKKIKDKYVCTKLSYIKYHLSMSMFNEEL